MIKRLQFSLWHLATLFFLLFNLSVNAQGDCNNPIQLTCGTPFTGTTVDGQSNFDVYGCAPQLEEGKEKIHTITITQNSNITATLSNLSVDLDVHILSSCDANSCIARDNISATAQNLSAGTYYIVVDGFGAAPAVEGAYTLEVTCSSNSGTGSCASPIALTCGTPYTGTTVDGVSNFDVYGCAPQLEEGKEKIHTITLTQNSDITATLSGMSVDLDVHILSSCDANSCIARDNVSATAQNLSAGTYYVVVDGFGAAPAVEGAYTLEVTCTPNAVSGTCASPIALTCGTPYTGSTTGLTNVIFDYSCSIFDNVGPEAIHTITATSSGTLTATLTRPSGMDMEVAILSACDGNACLDKTVLATGTTISASISNAVAGQQYYIVVDGDTQADNGQYTVEVTCPQNTSGDCANPIALTCGTPYTGTTVDGQSNFDVYGCAPQQEEGKEKIHTITLTQTADITATLSGMSVDLDVHILSSCDANSCIARDNVSATAQNLSAGTYYIVVDGFGAAPAVEGAYTLEVTCNTANNPGNCANPIALTCGTPYNGSTTGLSNTIFDYSCSIFDNVGPEAIHTITATSSGTLTATLTRPSGMDMEVAILSACDGNACLDKTVLATGTTISASISNAVAGQQYYIVVDGDTQADNGQYTIEVTCPQNTSGDCANPIALTCGTPFTGTTVDGQSNFDVYGCAPQQEEGKEKIHTITLNQNSDITATLSGMSVDLDVHILSSCDANSCLARDNVSATAQNLSAGTYYIVVDGFGAAPAVEGAYTLEVTCSANNTSGTCADPIALSCGTPYSGNTTGFLNNLGNYSCSNIDKIGPEVIHTITSPGNGTLTANLTRPSGVDLEVGILSACNETACLDITTFSTGTSISASITNAVAGQQYFIVVDGDETADFGAYTLEVTCPQSTTTGDCTNPIALTCGTPYTGTTADGLSNFNQYSCGSQQEGGKEKIHTITLTQASNITAALSGMTADLDVHVLSSCDANACLGRDDNSVTVNALAAGTYYVVVDGFGAAGVNEGAYTLEVTCNPINGGGTGDCSTPIALTCGTPYTGTTADGVSNFNQYSCGSQQEGGKEKIHTITLTQASNITAALSGMTADLDVHVLSSCDANACLGRDDNSVTVNALAAGTYYVVVDGFGAAGVNEGAYTLEVTCTPVNNGPQGCDELFFSEYIEGSGSNKAVEIYNPTNTVVNLANYRIEIFSNGSTNSSSTINLSGNLAAYGKYVVANANAVAGLTSQADMTSGSLGFNGDDAVVLLSTTDTIDIFGKIGEDPGIEWVNGTESSLDKTLYRIATVTQGVSTNPATFNPSTEWVSLGVDYFSDLGFHTSDCENSCTPNSSSPAVAICQGDSYVLGTQTLTTAGTYTETLTNVGGCDSVVTLTLTVNPLPSISAGNDITINNGDAVTLSGSGGASYTWNNGVNDGVAFTPAGTNTYIVTGTDANGCTNTDTVTVTVNGGVTQPCTELFISEYLEGSANNKAIEVYNPSSAGINLGSYSLAIFANGATTPNATIPLSGTLAPNSTFVVVNNGASNNLLALATIASASLSFNGDDAVVLLKNTTDTIDIIGKVGEDPGSDWLGGNVSTQNMTLVRKASVQVGVNTNPSTFNPSIEWDALAQDDISNIGTHSSSCSTNPCVDQITLNETICEGATYQFNGQNLDSSGTYVQTLTNAAGCDSITTLELTVVPTQFIVEDTICAGSSYVLGSQTLTQSGTYLETFQNSLGCDSVVLLGLTVTNPFDTTYSTTVCSNPFTFGTQTITQNGTYTEIFQTSSGCDSTVTLNITFGNANDTTIVAEICQGESYVLGTQTLTTTGSYTEVFSTAGGCDSTVNLTLSVKATPLITITENNGDLVSSNGTSYQWLLNGDTIPGATGQNYTPTVNGVYTVITTAFNGCSGTGTYNLQNVSVQELLQNSVEVMPNPTKGMLTVNANENVSIVVYNLIGEVVYTSSVELNTLTIDLTQKERGVYMVKVTNASNNSIVKRVVLN